ncbi:MAG: hypothetical protein JWP49_535 [Phenylobacterium sp.]|nr:hypothetical protein [Phenylobacterium sp.]
MSAGANSRSTAIMSAVRSGDPAEISQHGGAPRTTSTGIAPAPAAPAAAAGPALTPSSFSAGNTPS